MTQIPGVETRVPPTFEEAVGALLLFLAGLVALLMMALLAAALGPYLRRSWPRTARFISNLLPLPCEHADAYGASLTYRERRDVKGRAILHLVCAACGHATPAIDRTDEERDALVTAKPAHERMHARLTRPTPPASALEFKVKGRR